MTEVATLSRLGLPLKTPKRSQQEERKQPTLEKQIHKTPIFDGILFFEKNVFFSSF